MKMKINTYNYMKGKKIYMIKNIMGAAIAVALAAGVGTTGVRSNTTYKKPTQIVALSLIHI